MKMYELLFLKYAELQKLFAHKSTDQYMRLAEALSAYAINIDMIERLRPALLVIAQTHADANVKPIHYPMVGMALIEAIESVLGDRATLEFIDAWREAYRFVANILIEMQQEINKSQEL
nr:globin domain-containing protein [Sulfurimonas sp. SAG-AH-194-L11]